jgi:hypothetical protein
MKVLCKKTYKEFIKSNWYEVELKHNTYFDNGIVDSYFILSSYIDDDDKWGRRFVLDNWKYQNSNPRYGEPRFSYFFYTPKEMRKMKLEKLKNVS